MEIGPDQKAQSDKRVSGSVLADLIITRLTALESGQNTMNSALGLMLDTLQAQTNLLRRLSEYATEEPATSPVTKILSELTSAIMDLDASIGGLEKRFGQLSDTITTAYQSEAGWPPPVEPNSGSS